jgi:hypothetical protein
MLLAVGLAIEVWETHMERKHKGMQLVVRLSLVMHNFLHYLLLLKYLLNMYVQKLEMAVSFIAVKVNWFILVKFHVQRK